VSKRQISARRRLVWYVTDNHGQARPGNRRVIGSSPIGGAKPLLQGLSGCRACLGPHLTHLNRYLVPIRICPGSGLAGRPNCNQRAGTTPLTGLDEWLTGGIPPRRTLRAPRVRRPVTDLLQEVCGT
jgi:hypothetical protein